MLRKAATPSPLPLSSIAALFSLPLRAEREQDTTGPKKRRGSKVHVAVNTLGNLLALHVTPANEQDRAAVGELAKRVQEETGNMVEIGYVDQGYKGEAAAWEADIADMHDIKLEVVRLEGVKKGFVLLPRRWVVERSFGWANRFRRLARDYERLPETLKGLHFLAFAMLMLTRCVHLLACSS